MKSSIPTGRGLFVFNASVLLTTTSRRRELFRSFWAFFLFLVAFEIKEFNSIKGEQNEDVAVFALFLIQMVFMGTTSTIPTGHFFGLSNRQEELQ
jgi:hypothetical protein